MAHGTMERPPGAPGRAGCRAFEDFLRDVRFGSRQLARAPGFTAVAILALALGIGVTVTVFTVVNAVFLKPLPFERADNLYRIARITAGGGARWLTVPELQRWQSGSRTLTGLAGFTFMDFNLRGSAPEGVLVAWASEGLLEVLGVTPLLGRGFAADDFDPAAGRAALVSHELWRRRYGSDPEIVGSQVDLEGPAFLSESSGRYTIAGVLPAGFWLFSAQTDFVVPMRASAAQLNDPGQRLVETVVARAGMAGPASIRSDIAAITRQLEREAPPSRQGPTSIEVASIRDWRFGDLRQSFLIMLGTAVMVALIACANVSLILISRATHRDREFAVRLALGAGRARVIRQLLTESLLLSLIGGLAGVILAAAAPRLVAWLLPSQILSRVPGGLESLSPDARVLGVALGAIVLTGLVSGLGSLLAIRLRQSLPHLRQAAPGLSAAHRQPLHVILVVGQTATAVTLLIAAGLLARSLGQLTRVDLGIQAREGLVMWINLNPSRYPFDEDRVRFYETVLARLREQPEIRHASGVDLPFHMEWQTTHAGTASSVGEPDEWPEALARAVTPMYFERHGIRVVAGRAFTDRDRFHSTPVAVVSEALAERYWPGTNAIGQALYTRSDAGPLVPSTVVGVVSDIRSAPHQPARPIVYRPFQQAPPPWMYVTVEGATASSALLPAMRRAVWSVDPDQPLEGASGGPWTLDEMISDRTERPRLMARVGGALAAVALLLASIGVYGLLSYAVARRTSEVGVRMALGADAWNILSLVLGRSLALSAVGIGLGFGAAALASRFLEGLLFGVAPLDPVTFLGAGTVFLLVSLLASWIPARRAMAVTPVAALRVE